MTGTYTLEDFLNASPNNLSPLAFLKWIDGMYQDKNKIHSAYVSNTVSRNTRVAAINSSRLQTTVAYHQTRVAVKELLQEERQSQKQDREDGELEQVGLDSTTLSLFDTNLPSDEQDSDYLTSSTARSSLSSIEFHHYNYLVGPGTTSCALSRPGLEIDGLDVSRTLMEARKVLVKNQCHLSATPEILELLEDHSPEEVVRALTTGKKTEPTAEDVSVLVSTALYSAAHEYRDSLMFIREKALGSTSIAADLVLAYSSTSDF
ncbi:hypothetical protein BGZ97_004899 [Linnemannia gamsii]|uniref:Uncharacterized protein n=1 Tax=Linnemannia gamsii TaxID=64522 RepID=A0A9P6QR69_9FUNG|nr:hypothetical protein BGZ97_004899 [Linnemannia gamsii]